MRGENWLKSDGSVGIKLLWPVCLFYRSWSPDRTDMLENQPSVSHPNSPGSHAVRSVCSGGEGGGLPLSAHKGAAGEIVVLTSLVLVQQFNFFIISFSPLVVCVPGFRISSLCTETYLDSSIVSLEGG